MKEFKVLGPKELADLLGVSLNTIYYWVSKRQNPVIKMGKHNRFDYEEVLEFFKKGNEKN